MVELSYQALQTRETLEPSALADVSGQSECKQGCILHRASTQPVIKALSDQKCSMLTAILNTSLLRLLCMGNMASMKCFCSANRHMQQCSAHHDQLPGIQQCSTQQELLL